LFRHQSLVNEKSEIFTINDHLKDRNQLKMNHKLTQGFTFLMSDYNGIQVFRKYITSKVGLNNCLDFWLCAEGFRKNFKRFSEDERIGSAMAIYRAYIKKENSLPTKYHLKEETRKALFTKIEMLKTRSFALNEYFFQDAQKEVGEKLKENIYKDFIKSDMYFDFLKSIESKALKESASNIHYTSKTIAKPTIGQSSYYKHKTGPHPPFPYHVEEGHSSNFVSTLSLDSGIQSKALSQAPIVEKPLNGIAKIDHHAAKNELSSISKITTRKQLPHSFNSNARNLEATESTHHLVNSHSHSRKPRTGSSICSLLNSRGVGEQAEALTERHASNKKCEKSRNKLSSSSSETRPRLQDESGNSRSIHKFAHIPKELMSETFRERPNNSDAEAILDSHLNQVFATFDNPEIRSAGWNTTHQATSDYPNASRFKQVQHENTNITNIIAQFTAEEKLKQSHWLNTQSRPNERYLPTKPKENDTIVLKFIEMLEKTAKEAKNESKED